MTKIYTKVLRLFVYSFEPLKNKNIRIYMSGQAISLVGTWMQITAQAWVVWQLTHTAIALGTIALLSQLPFFVLGPLAGVWADRLDRRKILIVTQSISMILAFILAFLVQFHFIQLWHVYLLALCLGIVSALDMPSQQAFISDISSKEFIRKTVSVNISFIQLSRMVGPAIAGFIIATFGVAVAFWLNGISFLAVIISLFLISSTKQIVDKTKSGNIFNDFKEGVNFLFKNDLIVSLTIILSLMTFFGWSIVQLLPAVSAIILRGGAGVLGLLMGAQAAGALSGSLFIVPFGQKYHRPGFFIFIGVFGAGVSYLLFSFSSLLLISLFFIFLAGAFGSTAYNTSNGIIQMVTPIKIKARVLSLLMMITFGLQPIASFLIGLSADLIGISKMIFINGLILFIGALLLFYFSKTLKAYSTNMDSESEYEKFSASPIIEE